MTSVYYAKKNKQSGACVDPGMYGPNFIGKYVDNLKRQMYAAHSQHDVCGLLSNFKITPFVGTFILSLVFTFLW